MLYIQWRQCTTMSPWGLIHEETRRRKWGLGEDVAPTTWGADWYYYGAANRCRHTLYPCPCWLQEVSIITVIWHLVGLWDNNSCWAFEMVRQIPGFETCICYCDDVLQTIFILYNAFEMSLWEFVGAGSWHIIALNYGTSEFFFCKQCLWW